MYQDVFSLGNALCGLEKDIHSTIVQSILKISIRSS